uniref:Glycosyltransferase family 25 n=1 Tax=Mimiviridae sp. ChoanoV1 TaxID=2596887 RepID=A0A5B8IDI0_9VIRU|nr:glycosyltransferase family 25 [Mimiviridae sp. ChoanoV1]
MYQIALILIIIIFIKLYKKQEYFSNNKLHGSFFINVNRHTKRKLYMEKQFKINNIKCQRFSALDKNKIDNNFLLNLKKDLKLNDIETNKKKKGSIACLLSHTYLWDKIYNLSGDTYLIFEDDCKILPNFNKKLNYYLKRLPKKWDLIWLGYNNIKGEKYDDNFYIPKQGFFIGHNSQQHCYLINRKSVPKIKKILFPIPKNFKNKDQIFRLNFNKINAYFLNERLAVQDQNEFPTSERTGGKNG